jgi:hypothetical protein
MFRLVQRPLRSLLPLDWALICHQCGLSGHIRTHCSLLKAQRSKVKKELPRQATFGTRPLAGISSMSSGPTASGSSASVATAAICSCQSEWQAQDKQIKALHEEAAEA